MDKLGPSPFVWLDFDAEGKIGPHMAEDFQDLVASSGGTDLVIMSHGWKNTKQDAKTLYGTLWGNTILDLPGGLAEATLIAGVVWPAKKYATDFDQEAVALQTNGARAVHGGGAATSLSQEQFEAVLEDLVDLFGARAGAVIGAAQAAQHSINVGTAKGLMAAARNLLASDPIPDDPELSPEIGRIQRAAADPTRAQQVIQSMAIPPRFKRSDIDGHAEGLGDFVAGVVQGPRAAVARFLNQLTYFEMKKRAGIIGDSLARNVASVLRPTKALRVHLVGHSFGARLVTAAANAWQIRENVDLFSLTLLQAAFSHNGMAKEVRPGMPGAFHDVVGKLSGPISITHTHNDSACTIAYPLASRLARDIAEALGGADDKFGAMGANGPQLLTEAVVVNDNSMTFRPAKTKVNSFLGDGFIASHNDVANRKCGELLAKTLTA
ncbi:hypothetical protein CN217_25990 [Sinorhizobium meliloti]|uniref:alpha/beta fold hydrolase n=1 Tax=Rhizobium meliloti TaxID=382 RepID=UPI000FD32F65|nr:hypothetical protein [Sinorhizobium meliloti]RVH05446.1 hypothetical protein CN217_25990 [Sinorhizobium meliloti]